MKMWHEAPVMTLPVPIFRTAKDLRTDLTAAVVCSVQRSFAALRMTCELMALP